MEYHEYAQPTEETLRLFREAMAKTWTPECAKIHEEKIQKKRDQRNVYFILDGGFVKVGFSVYPEGRLSCIQTSNPRARLLGYIKGGCQLEKEIHRKLAEYKYDREWFYYTEEVSEIINQYRGV